MRGAGRTLRGTASIALAALALPMALACGGEEEPLYPSREWSGWFQSRMTGSSTDCRGAEKPPPLSGFTMTVEHAPDNDALVRMGTFVSLTGSFEGDSLHATHAFDVPVSLPDTMAARATPEDSLDTITYRLDAAFADSAYSGTYVVRTPDLNALARGERPGRCAYRYEIAGVEAVDLPTTDESIVPGASGRAVTPGGPAERP